MIHFRGNHCLYGDYVTSFDTEYDDKPPPLTFFVLFQRMTLFSILNTCLCMFSLYVISYHTNRLNYFDFFFFDRDLIEIVLRCGLRKYI